MPTVFRATTLSVSIARPPDEVYRFIRDARAMPTWATSFCRSVRPEGDGWLLATPTGPMRLRFVAPNALGVLDHHVRLASGQEILNPMRVIANGAGSEVLFTLFQPPEVTDARFAEDRAMVEADLRSLRRVLEG